MQIQKSIYSLYGRLWVAFALACLVCACQAENANTTSRAAVDTSASKDLGTFQQVPQAAENAYAPPANKDDGWFYQLSYRDVILSPNGGHLLAMVPLPGPDAGFDSPGLVLAVHDLQTATTHLLPAHADVRQVIFSPDSTQAYLLAADLKSIAVLDLKTRTQVKEIALGGAHSSLQVAPDGAHLIASNRPTDDDERLLAVQDGESCVALDGRDRCSIVSVRVTDASVRMMTSDAPVLDIDFVENSLLLTFNFSADTRDQATARIATVDVHFAIAKKSPPQQLNLVGKRCGTQLQVVASGKLGILSAVGCTQGGVDLFDLVAGKLLLSISSTAPVAVSRDGTHAAVAVYATHLSGKKLSKKTSIAVIDLKTKTYKLMPWGDHTQLPQLVISHDGYHLYARSSSADGLSDKFSMVRTHDLSTKPVIGGAKRLDQSAWSEDGKLLYVLSNGALYRIPTGVSVATHVNVPGSPELMNVRQTDDMLILAEATAPQFYLVDVLAGDTVESLHLFAK